MPASEVLLPKLRRSGLHSQSHSYLATAKARPVLCSFQVTEGKQATLPLEPCGCAHTTKLTTYQAQQRNTGGACCNGKLLSIISHSAPLLASATACALPAVSALQE